MRNAIFAAALLIGTAAVAQNTMPNDPVQPPAPGEPMTTPPAGTQDTTATPTDTNPTTGAGMAQDLTTTTTTMPDPAAQQPMQQDMQQPMNPPVQSSAGEGIPAAQQPAAPATTGAGEAVVTNPSPSVAQAFPAPAPQAEYPPCSRTVTDSCIQLYEPGVRRRR